MPVVAAWLGLSAPLTPAVDVEARWSGPPPVVVAARDWFGNPSRVVRPYPDDVLLVRLQITNHGDTPYRVPELGLADGGQIWSPLPYSWFQARWPAGAATQPDTMLDRTQAIAHIIRSRFAQELLLPGQTVEGLLAFPRAQLHDAHLMVGERQFPLGPQP